MKYVTALYFLFSLQTQAQQHFKVIALGVRGGIDESNLSSYAVAVASTNQYICLDAGSLYSGLVIAGKKQTIHTDAASFLKDSVKAYLISHPHLDHLAGLIINSPDDAAKNIYALPFCIDVLQHNYFTWKSWANFADSGDAPRLAKYHYKSLQATKETKVDSTNFTVTAFPLSHAGASHSTAFLIKHDDSYLLYLGDTGADSIEHTRQLTMLWQQVYQLIKAKQLKGIFIETSYPNEQPETKLFGHLTPALLMKAFKNLAQLTGSDAIKDLPVVITHMKPAGDHEAKIEAQLKQQNTLKLHLLFPKQGEAFIL